jgi:hypothetical protein
VYVVVCPSNTTCTGLVVLDPGLYEIAVLLLMLIGPQETKEGRKDVSICRRHSREDRS